MNYIMESVYGSGNGVFSEYDNAKDVATAARLGSLDSKIFALANKRSGFVCAAGEVPNLREISAMRNQWKFAKYLGLVVVDQLMSGTKAQRDEITTRMYLYATSASDNSAPYIKIS
jgi:hypothetical protein